MNDIDIMTGIAIANHCAAVESWRAVGVVTALAIVHVLALALLRTIWPKVSRWLTWARSHGVQFVVLAAIALGLTYSGVTKPGSVTFPYTDVEQRYLYDAGSYVTNGYVHVAFTKSAVVPGSADFLGYVRPAGSTNDDDWVQFVSSTFDEFHSPSNVPFAGAETNDFQFFTTFTPGPVVHTNGVAVILWQKPAGGSTNMFVTVRTGIYAEGRRLAPNPGITNGPPAALSIIQANQGENQ